MLIMKDLVAVVELCLLFSVARAHVVVKSGPESGSSTFDCDAPHLKNAGFYIKGNWTTCQDYNSIVIAEEEREKAALKTNMGCVHVQCLNEYAGGVLTLMYRMTRVGKLFLISTKILINLVTMCAIIEREFQHSMLGIRSLVTFRRDLHQFPKISITVGASISDSVTVSGGASYSASEVFSLTGSVSYTRTWTHSSSITNRFTIKDGEWGVIVVNARTTRSWGSFDGKCVLNCYNKYPDTKRTYSNADEHYNGPYGLVEGAYYKCSSKTYPIPYCVGTGTHY